MTDEKKRIIEEAILVDKAYNEEVSRFAEKEYSKYHFRNSRWYIHLSQQINSILNFNGGTVDELINHMSDNDITYEQQTALSQLRKDPMFKKLIGETALLKKGELETLLGGRIDCGGTTFSKNGSIMSSKTVEQLQKEWYSYCDKLMERVNSGQLAKEKCAEYKRLLDDIYNYFVSISKGEQVPFRMMSNIEYEEIEKRAKEKGIPFEEQFNQENGILIEDYAELQKHGMRK